MTRKIPFSKIVATGNDFVVIDNRKSQVAGRMSGVAANLCDRRFGIGADGLLIIERSKKADFKMRIFNPDGSEAEMCGNGSRCVALYAYLHKIAKSPMSIETKAGILRATLRDSLVKINMTRPKGLRCNICIEASGVKYRFDFIDTGVPHAVAFVKDIDNIDIVSAGSYVRHHRVFGSKGTNVDFIKERSKNAIFMRTYERGVEGETYACGTGATASAIIASILRGYSSPVKVHTKGGLLNIYFKKDKGGFSEVFLEGEAKEVFTGEIKTEA